MDACVVCGVGPGGIGAMHMPAQCTGLVAAIDRRLHLLKVSLHLDNTAEPLDLLNRRGHRPSHEGAAARFDQAITLCKRGGSRCVPLRGHTDSTQARHLDRLLSDGAS